MGSDARLDASLDSALNDTAVPGDGGQEAAQQDVSMGAVATLRFEATTLEIGTGRDVQLPLTVLDGSGNPTNAPVTMTSSDASKAMPMGRQVRGVAIGSATLTASANGMTATLQVTVEQGYATVRTGFLHSCGVTPTGEVYCWGCNENGQTGQNPPWASGYMLVRAPARVGVVPPVRTDALALGWKFSCGIAEGSQHVWCWGYNSDRQLGHDGDAWMPSEVHANLQFRQVAAGRAFACGITTDHQLYCWGDNGHGQLGVGDRTGGFAARMVGTYRTASLGNEHACAINMNNELYCWGNNDSGQLGIGSDGNEQLTPQRVQGGPWRDVELGEFYSCATDLTGISYCWGRNEQSKQALGLGDIPDGAHIRTPTMLDTQVRFAMLSAGFRSTCAITAAGELYCWGSNDYGVLAGAGTDWRIGRPARAMDRGLRFESLTLTRKQNCAITFGGVNYCWGENWGSTLGTAIDDDPNAPAGPALHGVNRPERVLSPRAPSTQNQPSNCGF